MNHSLISPSSAGQWVYCSAAPILQAGIPDNSDSAMEGDAIHWYAAEILSGIGVTADLTAPNGFIITKDQIGIAYEYIDKIHEVTDSPAVEMRVEAPQIHPESFGTVDAWYYDPVNNILHIWDLKTGWGPVEVFENWQLINYAAGILNQLKIDGHHEQSMTVRMTIIQPKLNEINSWTVNATELRPYFNQLYNATNKVFTDPKLCSGDHCRYCKVIYGCKANRQATLNIFDILDLPPALEDNDLSFELDLLTNMKKRIDNRIEGVSGQIESLLKSGKTCGDWGLIPSIGRAKWFKDPKEVKALGEAFGQDLTTLITPAQAIKKGIPKEVVSAYSERKTSMKLGKLDIKKVQEVLKNA